MAAACQFVNTLELGHLSFNFFQSSYWTTFIKLVFMSEHGFCMMNDNQDCRQNGYPLFTAGHYTGPFVRLL